MVLFYHTNCLRTGKAADFCMKALWFRISKREKCALKNSSIVARTAWEYL